MGDNLSPPQIVDLPFSRFVVKVHEVGKQTDIVMESFWLIYIQQFFLGIRSKVKDTDAVFGGEYGLLAARRHQRPVDLVMMQINLQMGEFPELHVVFRACVG